MTVNSAGDVVSVVPTLIKGTVANASSADVDFGLDAYILPETDGTIVVIDNSGGTAIVALTAGQFFPAMVRGVLAAGSDAIKFTYWI